MNSSSACMIVSMNQTSVKRVKSTSCFIYSFKSVRVLFVEFPIGQLAILKNKIEEKITSTGKYREHGIALALANQVKRGPFYREA